MKMPKSLETSEYQFYVDKGKLKTRYKNRSSEENDLLILSDLLVEGVGVTINNDSYFATITTTPGIHKLKAGVADTLEVIGFQAKDVDEALTIHHFIVWWLDSIEKEEEDDTGSDV